MRYLLQDTEYEYFVSSNLAAYLVLVLSEN